MEISNSYSGTEGVLDICDQQAHWWEVVLFLTHLAYNLLGGARMNQQLT